MQVAALLAAADLAEACDIDGVADFLRDTADAWNEQIEDWVYVTDTRLAREVGVAGYYVRIAPEVPGEARAELRGMVEVRNRFAGDSRMSRPTNWSAPMRWRWCASGCARPTIRASPTR